MLIYISTTYISEKACFCYSRDILLLSISRILPSIPQQQKVPRSGDWRDAYTYPPFTRKQVKRCFLLFAKIAQKIVLSNSNFLILEAFFQTLSALGSITVCCCNNTTLLGNRFPTKF